MVCLIPRFRCDDGSTRYANNSLFFVLQLDQLVGLAMIAAATFVFLYYSIWTLLMVGVVSLHSWPRGRATASC